MKQRVFLNIDWDFFIYEDPMWDWGHSEHMGITDVMWAMRAVGFALQGVDLRQAMDQHRYPLPEKFFKFLKQEMGLKVGSGCELAVGDSHSAAYHAYRGEDLVLNFDAHHDCGYTDALNLQREHTSAYIDAGAWLWHLLYTYPQVCAHVYQPHWKGWIEHEAYDGGRLLPRMQDRLWFSVIEEGYDYSEYAGAEISTVFIARSGAWTPPWKDTDFLRFLAQAEAAAGGVAELYNPLDVTRARSFDARAIDALLARPATFNLPDASTRRK